MPRYAYTETVAVCEPEHPAASEITRALRRQTEVLVQLAPPVSSLTQFGSGTANVGAGRA